jgi:hypothetical protein
VENGLYLLGDLDVVFYVEFSKSFAKLTAEEKSINMSINTFNKMKPTKVE